MKTLGIFIATPGRRSLFRTLQSIAWQKAPVEDILVVGDGHHEPTAALVEMAADALKLPVRYVATEKTRDWGHSQQNYALKHVRGDYIIYQDDDDIFLPRALTEAALLADRQRDPKPIIGRVKTPRLGVLWQEASPVNACLDGHCLLVPNDKKKLGWFNSGYNGDQCFIHTTLRNFPEWEWADRVWTLTRPTWTLTPDDLDTRDEQWWRYYLYRVELGVPVAPPVAWLHMQVRGEDSLDVMYGVVPPETTLTLEESMQIAEMAAWGAQSKDVFFQAHARDEQMHAALEVLGYTFHGHPTMQLSNGRSMPDTDRVEYTHDWPPTWWGKHPPFNILIDPVSGKQLQDWRDPVWGGRPNT